MQSGNGSPCFAHIGQEVFEKLVHVFSVADVVDLNGAIGVINSVKNAKASCSARAVAGELPLEGLAEIGVFLNFFDAQFHNRL